MTDIFLSYSSEDRAFAMKLATHLKSREWSVWWDTQISPGDTWHAVIEGALDEASVVIVLLSKSSIKSKWVMAEAEDGATRNALIPIIIERGVGLPLYLRTFQAADLSDWKGEATHAHLLNVEHSLSTILGTQPPTIVTSFAKPPNKKPTVVTPLIMALALAAIGGLAWFVFDDDTTSPRSHAETTRELSFDGKSKGAVAIQKHDLELIEYQYEVPRGSEHGSLVPEEIVLIDVQGPKTAEEHKVYIFVEGEGKVSVLRRDELRVDSDSGRPCWTIDGTGSFTALVAISPRQISEQLRKRIRVTLSDIAAPALVDEGRYIVWKGQDFHSETCSATIKGGGVPRGELPKTWQREVRRTIREQFPDVRFYGRTWHVKGE